MTGKQITEATDDVIKEPNLDVCATTGKPREVVGAE
jgi:hypothetical protein